MKKKEVTKMQEMLEMPEMPEMPEKRKRSVIYIVVFMAAAALGLVTVAGLTFAMDPLFQYHMPWFGKEAYFDDERYQNPGVAKNADYDAIIIGSSMSENFNGEWFDGAYGVNTIKLTYSGCTAQDWVNAVVLGQKYQKLRYVFGNIEAWMVMEEYGKTRRELPQYLYDDNYLNDINYLLNKDVFFDRTVSTLIHHYRGNLKTAYAYYENMKAKYGHQNVLKLKSYGGAYQDIKQKKAVIDDNVMKTVRQIKETVLQYPDTRFELFLPPYSILCWYSYICTGEFDYRMEICRYLTAELLECENCELYFPMGNIERIEDLDAYKDLSHYDMDMQYTIFEEMRDGINRLTKENYREKLDEFREKIENYDFGQLYEKYKS